MALKSVLNLLILLFPLLRVRSIKQTYDVENFSVENFPGKLLATNLKVIGRDRVINGTVEFLMDLSEEIIFSLQLYSNAGFLGYKQMPLEVPEMPICTAIRSYYKEYIKDTMLEGVVTNFNYKNGTVCPLPKGLYWVKNGIFNTEGWVAIMPRGLIKARLNVIDDSEFGGAIEIIVNIKDKLF